MENKQQENHDLLKAQGCTYTRKSKKLEDAKSSSYLFIVFGIVGLLLLAALWLGLLPLVMALYMKILYTIVLGVLFIVFIVVGIHYTRSIKVLTRETHAEEHQTEEIVSFITSTYPLEVLDTMIDDQALSMEQLYFERYEKIASIIREKYQIQEEGYLDYLIEKIYQMYSPES